MKPSDRYHKWVEWSEADAAYLGRCPDVITGIHGDDPVALYQELQEVVETALEHLQQQGRSLPEARVRPMTEVL